MQHPGAILPRKLLRFVQNSLVAEASQDFSFQPSRPMAPNKPGDGWIARRAICECLFSEILGFCKSKQDFFFRLVQLYNPQYQALLGSADRPKAGRTNNKIALRGAPYEGPLSTLANSFPRELDMDGSLEL